ncbi:MAG: PHP domain-containing protein [Ruminococcaceae bacterium]|nr:PHP domain-containing protein [Oscillospiraceae bacterium]
MRIYLLPKEGQFYKANLHTHTTVSDGAWTPEEVKKQYKERGYSIIAFTDHDVMIDHSDLAEENFLPLRGYELEVGEIQDIPKEERVRDSKTCHMCFIALEPDNRTQVCWHREKYLGWGNMHQYAGQIKFDESLPDYERFYSAEKISEMMQIGRNNGFFVTYNHPAWSLETANEYMNYDGMHAMEICNFGCWEIGYEDYVPGIYDEMLRGGKRIFCTATDDNHNKGANPTHDSFGGFTMIKADKLEYRTVTKALERGDFYASMGPEIYDLYVEDGMIHITCSPAVRISMNTGKRHAKAVWAEQEKTLCEATFPLRENSIYFRLDVMDERGRHANTRAYFLDELNG